MKVGVYYFAVDYGIDIAELAAALEHRGFESLFVPEHTHSCGRCLCTVFG
jgi:alkanesulfonate monooxygenase SsuD/methylene tetrahydromethanopterin reductase-like flavin-dependent oxidoreductase (luciferase family)